MVQSGDVRGGVRAALALGRQDVLADCAAMLEASGTALTEAAELHQACGQVDQAAAIYIKLKAFAKAEPLMRGVKSAKLTLAVRLLHALAQPDATWQSKCRDPLRSCLQFARAKEAEGKFLDAAAAYERAGDIDAAVRLHLHKLSNPAKAYALARSSGSSSVAAAVAKACLDASIWPVAVEFLVRSGEISEAWQVAQIHGAADAYAAALPKNTPTGVHAKVAQHFQGHGAHSKAAEQFRLAGNLQACIVELMAAAGKVGLHTPRINISPTCLKRMSCVLYRPVRVGLQAGSEEERGTAMSRALQLVSEAPRDQGRRLARMVLGSLGAADQSRCAEQLVELNLALGNRAEAASAAAMSALSDQKAGNYKVRLALISFHAQSACWRTASDAFGSAGGARQAAQSGGAPAGRTRSHAAAASHGARVTALVHARQGTRGHGRSPWCRAPPQAS